MEGSDTDFAVGLDRSLSLLSWDAGKDSYKIRTIHTIDDHLPNNSANDGKADAAGNVWFGSFDRDVSKSTGSIYCATASSGNCIQKQDGILLSNGLDFDGTGG